MTGCESNNTLGIGDGFCDDENNNQYCYFDGGDCCGDGVDKNYCTECACFE